MTLTFSNRFCTQVRRTPTHIYVAPHPLLRPYVAHYTICLEAPLPLLPAPETLTLLPDASGCLVFTLSERGFQSLLFGPTSLAVQVENDLGACPLRFFVEFRPGGLYAMTGLTQWELTNRALPLGDVAPNLDGMVWRCFCASANLDEFVARVDAALAQRQTAPSACAPFLSWITRSPGPVSLSMLTEYSGYSARHLSRLFRQEAGLSAKAFTRVLRVNAAARRIRAGAPSLTLLAQELGYYDQAHFIHEFHSVCKISPAAYRAQLCGYYEEPLKF